MPPNKKIQHNAFYYYMKQLMEEMKLDGHNFPNGLADMVAVAGPKWKLMTTQEKYPYEKLSREVKDKSRKKNNHDKKDVRLDCTGKLISSHCEPLDEMAKQYSEQEREVTSKWPRNADIFYEKFYLINFQLLCKTSDNEYLPVEVSVLEYNMKEGITKEMHEFINAGPIPVGYRYEAQFHSENTHQIPIENFELASADYTKLWDSLLNFSDKKEFYCLSKDFNEIERCLDWIRDRSESARSEYIQLYALEKLVMDLFKHNGFPVAKYQILDMLTTTAFDYEPNTRCPWHEQASNIHCSLAIIRRYAYAMSDSLVSVYEFALTSQHLPVKDSKSKGVSLNPPHFGSRRNQSCRPIANKNTKSENTSTIHSNFQSADEEDELEALRKPLTNANITCTSTKHSYFDPFDTKSENKSYCWRENQHEIKRDSKENEILDHSFNVKQAFPNAPNTNNTLADSSKPSSVWVKKPSPRLSEVSETDFPSLSSTVSPASRGATPSYRQQVAMQKNIPNRPCFAAMAGRGRGRGLIPNTCQK
ncbi:protein maelstrom homolog [Argonauta hians]